MIQRLMQNTVSQQLSERISYHTWTKSKQETYSAQTEHIFRELRVTPSAMQLLPQLPATFFSCVCKAHFLYRLENEILGFNAAYIFDCQH